MGETETATAPTTSATTKKPKTAKKPRKPKAASSHPKVAEMVSSAMDDLVEEKGGGISLQAIKRYISSTYKVDMNRQAIFIRRYLKSAVANGTLAQTKGVGANGTFQKAAPASSGSKTARQQAIASKPKPKKPAAKAKKAKKTKVAAKKTAVKALKTKTPAKKASKTKAKAKSSAKKGKK